MTYEQSYGAECDRIELIVTNETPSTRQLLASHPPEQLGYRLLVMPGDEHFITLPLGNGPIP